METIRKKSPLIEQDLFYAELDGKHSRIEDIENCSQRNFDTYGSYFYYQTPEIYDKFVDGYYDTE